MTVEKEKILRWTLNIGGVGFFVPKFVFGQSMPQSPVQSADDVVTSLCTVAAFLFLAAIAVGIIFVLVAAFKYLTAGGDSSKVSEAHKAVGYAAVGFAVAIIANGVPSVVSSILGGSNIQGCV